MVKHRRAEKQLIESKFIAKQISELMQDCTAQLDGSVALVRDKCSAEELHIYRRAVGKVMGEILLEVLNPLYAKHPTLRPPGWD
jgi:hypothetical protein